MDCICLNRKRKKKGRSSEVKKEAGQTNSAYVSDDDDDMMKNNAVLAEIDASQEARTDDKSDVPAEREESANGNQTSQASTNVSIRLSPSDKSLHTSDSLLASSTQLFATQDDLYLDNYKYDCYDVQLMSKDSVGPGFSITGTVTDGIVIGKLNKNGPAIQSGQMAPGDRLLSVTIGFDNIAYEDALTILSYAAPYPMVLKLARGSGREVDCAPSSVDETDHHSKIYHPVYRSQSVGAVCQSKKAYKIPSRPGTSLGQDYKTREMLHEGSRDSPDGGLVKGKFENTMNLIDGSDFALHILSDSDTTVDSSLRSESQPPARSLGLEEATEEVASTFFVPVQAVAGSSLDTTPVAAEVIVTEPPTQLKLASLSSVSPTHDEMYSSSHSSRVTTPDTYNSTHSSRVTTPTSPSQIPPEKPKRIHQLIASGEMLPPSQIQNSLVIEEEISPSSKVVETYALPDKREEEKNLGNLSQDNAKHTQALLVLEAAQIEDVVDIMDEIGESSSPVEEPIIQTYIQTKENSSNIESWVNNNGDMMTSPDAVSRPSTLTVDTVKINDTDEFQIEASTCRDSNTLSQQSPNDSGIHSEKAPSEQEEPTSPADGASSNSSSPKLNLRHEMSSSSDDLVSAVLSLSTDRKEQEFIQSPSTPSSQSSTPRKLSLTGLFACSYVQQPPNIKRRRPRPRSTGSVSGVTSTIVHPPGPVIPKATSRSQLEAARARFFAELMQTSDIFKDEPAPSLNFSSESINTEPTLSPVDPFSKYTSSSTTSTRTNNNTLLNNWRKSDSPPANGTEQESSA